MGNIPIFSILAVIIMNINHESINHESIFVIHVQTLASLYTHTMEIWGGGGVGVVALQECFPATVYRKGFGNSFGIQSPSASDYLCKSLTSTSTINFNISNVSV